MSAQLLTSQSKLLVKCLVGCIVATAGNSVTEEKSPDRDFAVLIIYQRFFERLERGHEIFSEILFHGVLLGLKLSDAE